MLLSISQNTTSRIFGHFGGVDGKGFGDDKNFGGASFYGADGSLDSTLESTARFWQHGPTAQPNG
jgi:hypothetical protein